MVAQPYVALILTLAFMTFIYGMFLGSYVLYKGPKLRSNRAFAYFAFSVAALGLGDFMRKFSQETTIALFWTKVTLGAAIFLSSTYLLLALNFYTPSKYLDRLLNRLLILIPVIVLIPLLFTDLLISGVTWIEWRYSAVTGPLIYAFIVAILFSLVVGTVRVIRTIRHITPLKWIFVTISVIAALGFLTNTVFDIEVTSTISPLAIITLSLFGILVLRFRYVLAIPILSPDVKLDEEEMYGELKAGGTYVVEEDRPVKTMQLIKRHRARGRPTLVITRLDPETVRREFKLADVPVIWLSNVKGENNIEPSALTDLMVAIRTFLEHYKGALILFHGLEYLLTYHEFNTILRFLHHIRDYVIRYKANLVLSVTAAAWEPRNLKTIETEFEVLTL